MKKYYISSARGILLYESLVIYPSSVRVYLKNWFKLKAILLKMKRIHYKISTVTKQFN